MAQDPDKPNAASVDSMRLDQAIQLRDTVLASCIIVEAVIVSIAVLLVANGNQQLAITWTGATTTMVAITFLYSKLPSWRNLDAINHKQYLRGHVFVTCLTGCVWSTFAIHQIEPNSLISLSIAVTITVSITLGGLFPSSAYRASFVGLVTFCVLPLTVYWFVAVPEPMKYQAVGLLVYYLFALTVSARNELNMRDIILARHQRAFTQQLQEEVENAERANEEKNHFMQATVHDFSQPLQAQGFFIEALRSRLRLTEDLDLLDRIESNWRSQKDLLDAMAEISDLDEGSEARQMVPTDVAALLKEVAAEFEKQITEQNIQFESRLTDSIAITEPTMLTRIVRNLLMNAFKFTKPYDSIVVQNYRVGDKIVIKIRDSGIGIAERDQARVFGEYVQLNNRNRDRDQGLGLGLSIVRRMSEQLGIEVKLESTLGEGSIFTLRVPASQRGIKKQSADNKPINFDRSAPLVLVVDDEPDILEGLRILLTGWGCNVVTAATANEARKLVSTSERKPSLLIVDQRISNDETGLELIETLRDELNHGVSAILLTGDVEIDLGDEELDIQLMHKPVEPQTLNSTLQRALPG